MTASLQGDIHIGLDGPRPKIQCWNVQSATSL